MVGVRALVSGLAACVALPFPALAAPSPHNLALAAGYKAAFLCSGLFDAGESEEEHDIVKLLEKRNRHDLL